MCFNRRNSAAPIANVCYGNGFLQEVIKGWLISSNPGAREGDSTPWYASFWEFCARYCG